MYVISVSYHNNSESAHKCQCRRNKIHINKKETACTPEKTMGLLTEWQSFGNYFFCFSMG